LQLDLSTLSPGRAYRFLISAIVPRPIAFVSTLSVEGTRNLAPFSYFMGVGPKPPTVALSIIRRRSGIKDTARNILETREFVINSATEDIARQLNRTSGDYAPDIDEFSVAGLTPVDSVRVKPPRVAESPVQLECRLYQSYEIGEPPLISSLIVGEVLLAHVGDDLWEEAMVQAERLRPVARLGSNLYTTLGGVFAMDRPETDDEGRPI
jgi:flavin reductase (DIM6/NTAB) family NADH-FMN oxidoreductase RutF